MLSLLDRLSPVVYMPGDFILRQGEMGRALFFIARGSVLALQVLNKDGGTSDESETLENLSEASRKMLADSAAAAAGVTQMGGNRRSSTAATVSAVASFWKRRVSAEMTRAVWARHRVLRHYAALSTCAA